MKSFSILFTESIKEVEDLNEQIQLLDEMPGANMDTRAVHKHLKKQGWSLTRSSGGHDVFTHPEAKHHIPVPRHRQLKAPLVRGILKQSEVRKEEVELDEARANTQAVRQGLSKRQKAAPSAEAQATKAKESDAAWAMLQAHMAKKKQEQSVKEEIVQEGRPSQRHPLEGHEYHRKTDAELEYIAKDAHKAAEAMKSHNTAAENKYRDQASDSATVRYFRKKNGMPNWYKKKYGHVNEEVIDEGVKSPGVGWMLKADPKLGAKVDANKKKFKAFKQNVGNKDAGKKVIKEDDVINANSQNSLDGIKPPQKKKPEVDRYMTGQSTQVASTNVVASPRESVEIQEGRMKDMATDTDFHPTVTKSEPPFDKPYKQVPKNVKDKSGAVHTPMSRARDIARKAARKQAGLKEDNDNTLSSYDKEDTPAKKTLSKTAGMVKDLADKAKVKAKTKTSNDKFQPEPELNSNIVR